MLRSAVCLLLFAATVLGASLESERIYGGQIVPTPDKYPFKCVLRYQGFYQCGCIILSENYVLTSARCANVVLTGGLLVHVGSNHINEGTEDYGVDQQTKHFDFMVNDFFSPDLSILHVETPIVFNANVGPVTLPTQNDPTPTGTDAVVIGWGYTAELGPNSPQLQEADAVIMDHTACKNWYAAEGVLTDRQICTTNTAGGVCNGDNGGPLLVDGVLHGVVSWTSDRCAAVQGFPGIYTRVASFRDWIDSVITPTP